jgi:methylenetetrahydrofolate reductase (NADPH)
MVETSQRLAAAAQLFDRFSVEIVGKDVPSLHEAAPLLPQGTRVNVTYLSGETMETRIGAVDTVRELGLLPVPHISARRLQSERQLDGFLAQLVAVGGCDLVFAVGGDPAEPEGPFEDALALIRSGALERHGASEVSIAGYPQGHPDISDDVLWRALLDKRAEIEGRGFGGAIVTQFSFDAERVLGWIGEARERGVELPIRVGVPGPAGVRRLLAYAKRFGVGSSAGVARKYGLSLTNLMSTAGPDRFIAALAEGLDPNLHGEVKLHFYTFGGLAATANWIRDFQEEAQA